MTTQIERQVKDQKLKWVFDEITDAWRKGKHHIYLEGGTSASKTYSAMQFLVITLSHYKTKLLASVISESMPHLKRGAIRDFLEIMGSELIDSCWNKTDFIYTWPETKCQLEFISADQPVKMKGGRREIAFFNEVNNIARDSYREADMRTSMFTICDWNPVGEFWFHDEKLGEEKGCVFVEAISYTDVIDIVPDRVIKEVESYKDKDPNWYRVYALGLLGSLEGLVYPKFEQVDVLPEGNYFYGLDYGFSSDPTVLVKNVILGDKLYSQEMFYNYDRLTNDQIAREMSLCQVGDAPVYADPDEPKSAEELRRLGYTMLETVKGKGSVEFGIQKVNQYYQHWTKDSLNCIKEQRNFRFLEDKEHRGRFTKDTTHQWSHGMDARRYPVASRLQESSGIRQKATSYI